MTTRDISILATEAYRLLKKAGWDVRYADHAMVLRSGRLVREVTYDDSLGSLVPKPDIEWLILLGKRRHETTK